MPNNIYKKAGCINRLKTQISAISANEGLARSLVCAFAAQLNPTVDELADVRCAVSEAVTNCIVHGYQNRSNPEDFVYITAVLYSGRAIKLTITDKGCGIPDVKKAMEPLYTTDTTGERSGMGFSIMSSFMDSIRVKSTPQKGTTIELRRHFEPEAPDSVKSSQS